MSHPLKTIPIKTKHTITHAQAASIYNSHFLAKFISNAKVALIVFIPHLNNNNMQQNGAYSEIISHIEDIIQDKPFQSQFQLITISTTAIEDNIDQARNTLYQQTQHISDLIQLGYHVYAFKNDGDYGVDTYHMGDNPTQTFMNYFSLSIKEQLDAFADDNADIRHFTNKFEATVEKIEFNDASMRQNNSNQALTIDNYYLPINTLSQSFQRKKHITGDEKYECYFRLCIALQTFCDQQTANNKTCTLKEFYETNYDLCLELTKHSILENDFFICPDAFWLFSHIRQDLSPHHLMNLSSDIKTLIGFELLISNGLEALMYLTSLDKSFMNPDKNPLFSFLVNKKHIFKYLSLANINKFVQLYHQIDTSLDEQSKQKSHQQLADLLKMSLVRRVKSGKDDFLFSTSFKTTKIDGPHGAYIRKEDTNNIKSIEDIDSRHSRYVHDPSVNFTDPNQLYTRFANAIIEGDDKQLGELLQQEYDQNIKTLKTIKHKKTLNTLLTLACKIGTPSSVEQLYLQGFQISEKADGKSTLKHIAAISAISRQNDTFKFFMTKYGEDILKTDDNVTLFNAIDEVIDDKNFNFRLFRDIKHRIILPGRNQPCELLTAAVAGKNSAVVKALIKKPSFKATKNHVLYAIFNDDKQTILALCHSNPALLAATFNDEKFPYPLLSIACKLNLFNAAQALIELNADANQTAGKMKKTPLMYAAENGHTELCELLIKHGADTKASDKLYRKASYYANQPLKALKSEKERLQWYFTENEKLNHYEKLYNALRALEKDPKQEFNLQPSPN